MELLHGFAWGSDPYKWSYNPGNGAHVWLPGAAFEFLPEHPCRLTNNSSPFATRKTLNKMCLMNINKKVI